MRVVARIKILMKIDFGIVFYIARCFIYEGRYLIFKGLSTVIYPNLFSSGNFLTKHAILCIRILYSRKRPVLG